MWSARWALVSLWFSQTSRVMADNALRFFACLEYASQGESQKNSAWYVVTAIFSVPAIMLAPLNGALCNSLPKRKVLTWAALAGVLTMAIFGQLNGYWLWCWGLIAIGSAIYSPTRYAMLPAAAQDSHWPLTRINGFIEMGTFTAILGGLIVIAGTTLSTITVFDEWNAAIVLIFVLNCVAFSTALPVRFPSDVRRDESAWDAIRGFFRDFRSVWRVREVRIALIGLSGKRGLIIGMSNAMIAIFFGGAGLDLGGIAEVVCWVAGGVAVGSLIAGLQK